MAVLGLSVVAHFGVAAVAHAGVVSELGGVGHLAVAAGDSASEHVLGGTSVFNTTCHAIGLAHDFNGPLAGGLDDVLRHKIVEHVGPVCRGRLGGATAEPVTVNDVAVVAAPLV